MTDWIEANGVQLRYELTRGLCGTIVLIHEMGGTMESWDRVVAPLARHANILRYDQRGAGLSEKPRGPYSIGQAASDVGALLDALSIAEPVVAIGAAVGAAVAAQFAADQPDRTAALVMLAPSTGISIDDQARTIERIEAIERHGIRHAFKDGTLHAPRGRYETIRLSGDPYGLAETWRMLAGLEMKAAFARIGCPTLVAAGRHDDARPPDHVSRVASMIPDARFTVLDTGHLMAIDTPDLVAGAVIDFLTEICGDAA